MRLLNYFWVLALAIGLAACTALPATDTPAKKIAVTEIAINEALKQIVQYRGEGRFSAEEWRMINQTVADLQLARDAMHEAWAAGEAVEGPVRRVNTLLIVLRNLLEESP